MRVNKKINPNKNTDNNINSKKSDRKRRKPKHYSLTNSDEFKKKREEFFSMMYRWNGENDGNVVFAMRNYVKRTIKPIFFSPISKVMETQENLKFFDSDYYITKTYAYDASGNLLTAARNGRTESWTYDAAGIIPGHGRTAGIVQIQCTGEPEDGKNNSLESNILIPDENPEPDNLPADSNSVKPNTLTQERIDYYLGKARQNNECDTVVLGCDGVYDEYAKDKHYAHFKMEQTDWAALEKETGKDYKEIWKVNQQYLDEQIAANKKILLTNVPDTKYLFDDGSERFYQKELKYLDELGYGFVTDTETNLWCAVKKNEVCL